jgi:hypothetical protein
MVVKKYFSMKKNFKTPSVNMMICLLAVVMALASCKKNNGAPTPVSTGISPDSASGGSVLTLRGSGLSDMRSIVFDNHQVPSSFNPNFNTDGVLIFRVPDTAYGGPQHILFTNVGGKTLSIPFTVIALATVSQASLYEFSAGTQITLTGNNLDNVTNVVLHGTNDKAVIVSKTRKTLVITMPATSVTRARLDITNSSGTIVTNQEFVSVDNALQLFTENFGAGVYNWSWSSASISSDFSVLGTKSLKSVYSATGWQAVSLHCSPTIDASQYTYYTFWIKGGTQDNQLDVKSENGGSTKTITVLANVWNYYKFPVSGFITGFPIERLDFQIHGPDNSNQTLYFDDILMVK